MITLSDVRGAIVISRNQHVSAFWNQSGRDKSYDTTNNKIHTTIFSFSQFVTQMAIVYISHTRYVLWKPLQFPLNIEIAPELVQGHHRLPFERLTFSTFMNE
jgi:hypothetical protein